MNVHRARRHAPLLVVGVVGVVAVTGCLTTTTNYQRDAETYIEKTVSATVGATFSRVECERPTDQNIGTRFECTALDDTNGAWVFDNEITADNEFTVNVFSRP